MKKLFLLSSLLFAGMTSILQSCSKNSHEKADKLFETVKTCCCYSCLEPFGLETGAQYCAVCTVCFWSVCCCVDFQDRKFRENPGPAASNMSR
jgi:hypothetical protein